MSADKKPEGEAAPKKKGGMGKMMIMMLVAVLLGGGGVGGALYASGLISGGGGEEEDHGPRHELVAREGVSSAQVRRGREAAEHGQAIDPQVFQATYQALPNNFTSNLQGGASFVQIGLGVSTYYGEPVTEALTRHEMAIRSAVLMILSQQEPGALSSPEGKERLRGLLKNAVNGVLTNREGFGGIDEVYFTSFVTQ